MSNGPRNLSGESALLIAALIKASTDRVTVPFNSHGAAVRFAQRLHNIRKRMRKELHPSANLVERVVVRRPVEGEPGKFVVILEPRESDFQDELAAAGITLDFLARQGQDTPMPLPIPADAATPHEAALDKTLDEIFGVPHATPPRE
jgi:hypothetical protein